ncbi:purine-binding chemotaxis protein CheW [Dyella sp. SG562]|uniref:chemotaxis protein CheW n=2 Tax=unclassified Dyella TaxID=2634549 RepID=UPI0014238831|nr:chemotaxis protein CheW [Dyella sp. SG562]NII74379.1 purine-binding chemotaxis protein CheW [Dyella sp. SG562]
MNQDRASAPPAERGWLIFHLAGQPYAAPLTQVSEVVRDGDITPVPGAAADLLGIRQLRGRIVPVLDGCRRLGLPVDAGESARRRIVVLSHQGHLVGLRVDAVGDLLDVSGEVVAAPPGRVVREDDPVEGVAPCAGGFVALLDVRRLCRLPEGLEAVA